MPDFREVYVWPESDLYLYTGSLVTTASFPGMRLQFGQNISLSDSYQWSRALSTVSALPRERVSWSLQDQDAALSLDAFFPGLALKQFALSATAINGNLLFSAQDGTILHSAGIALISGRITQCDVVGQAEGIWQYRIETVFAESSAMWV